VSRLANIDCTVAQRTLDCYIGTIDQYCNIGHFSPICSHWANVSPMLLANWGVCQCGGRALTSREPAGVKFQMAITRKR